MDSIPFELPFRHNTTSESEASPSSQASEVSNCPLDLHSDTKLLELFRKGSKESMDVLYGRYRRLILSVGWKILRDHSEAEDVLHDIFLEICRRAELFDAKRGALKMWFLQYAYSRSLDRKKYLALRNGNGHSVDGNGSRYHQEFQCDPSPSALD